MCQGSNTPHACPVQLGGAMQLAPSVVADINPAAHAHAPWVHIELNPHVAAVRHDREQFVPEADVYPGWHEHENLGGDVTIPVHSV